MKYFSFIILLLLHHSVVVSQSNDHITFDFGRETLSKGLPVTSPIPYQTLTGYGFDFESSKNILIEEKALTSTSPIYFSIKLPEGNYSIEVDLGSDKFFSQTNIKAESRRLMLCKASVKKGDTQTASFIVNRRGIKINSEKSVNLKARETDDLNWDQKLTLEFSGTVAIRAIRIKPAKNYTTVFLAGDSTVTDQDVEPWASWGQMIPQFFSKKIVVANYAASGESLGSFKARNRLKKILHQMQKGDYLFIEFGHNDQKIKGERNGAYGLYTQLLKEYIASAREKGGIPVLLTPTQRRQFDQNGLLKNTHGEFPDAMRKVAEALEVPLIDLTKITTKMYEAWGMEGSKNALVHYPANSFPGQDTALSDNTHFNVFGANEIALATIDEIRRSELPLKNQVRKDTPHYNPEKPNDISNWRVPASPRFENTKPEGN